MIFYNPGTKRVWLEVGDRLIDMTGGIAIDERLTTSPHAIAIHQHDTRMDQLVELTNDTRIVAKKLAK